MALTRINAENIQQTTLDNLGSGPLIANVQIADSNYDVLDDTAIALDGGYIIINGTKFEQNVNVLIDGTQATSVTYISENQIAAQVGAKSAGSYIVYVVNTDTGATAIRINGLTYSDFPSWSTDSTLSGSEALINVNIQLIATDATSYSLAAGNTLPSDLSLNSAGYITGTVASNTTTNYNFTVLATDDENQDSPRSFTLPITQNDPPSWVTASDLGSVVNASAYSTTVVATDNQSILYSLEEGSTLPTGLTLNSNGNISGTISVEEANTYSFNVVATDSANLYSSRTFSVTVTFGDDFFNQTSLALNADDNTFISDASDNAFTITPNGDTRPSAFSPYNTNWSNYFDGNGDYLTIPGADAFALGTGDFTVELWAYVTASQIVSFLTSNYTYTTAQGNWSFYYNNGTYYFNAGGTNHSSTTTLTLPLNSWTHVAYTRVSGTGYFWINGTQLGNGVVDTSNYGGSNTFYIGRQSDGSGQFIGYMSNARIVKGTAVYTSNFTPPTAPLAAISGTSLLTCQSNRLIDNSTNNFTITKNGDVKVTSFAPFTETDTSTGSGYFDGTGDYLSLASSPSLQLGSGDFTAEMFLYISGDEIAPGGYGYGLFGTYDAGSNGGWSLNVNRIIGANYGLFFILSNSIIISYTTGLLPKSQWHHIAVVREGSGSNNLSLFLNGTRVAQTTNTTNDTVNSTCWIGTSGSSSNGFQGYISNARFIKGTAVYSGSTYTVPTAPLTAITNTSLLTLQNRIGYNNSQPIDESGIKNLITRNGNAAVGTFSPLGRTGWSAYFDGNGDYLTVPASVEFDFGTGDFTISCWVYFNSYETTAGFIVGQNFFSSVFQLNSSWQLQFYSQPAGAYIVTGSTAVPKNEWVHVALTRSGNTFKVFLNGSVDGTGTNSSNAGFSSGSLLTIAAWNNIVASWTGYISNLHIVKGTAIDYTQTPVPTAPLEPIAGTSLLTLRGPSFTDDGPNRLAITRNGDTKITPFSPFAPHTIAPDSYSVYFDGTGDTLTLVSSTEFAFGSGAYTVEAFVYLTAHAATATAIFTNGSATNALVMYVGPSGQLLLGKYGVGDQITSPNGVVPLNSWNHIAIVRTSTSSNDTRMYVNGTLVQTGTDSNDWTVTTTPTIGGLNLSGYFVNGYISNLRIVKGTAIVPPSGGPTSSLTAISGTSLLTCQSPTVTDNSTNDFAITVNGNSQPTKFNPFGETVATGVEYSPVSHGGSIYFDGTGDQLVVSTSSDFSMGTGQFTVEYWVYRYAATQYHTLFTDDGTGSTVLQNFVNTSHTAELWISASQISGNFGSLLLNQWNHVVIQRDSENYISAFVNGVRGYYAVRTDNLGNKGIRIGGRNQDHLQGYMSGFRWTRGRALYNGNFSPPAAPLTPTAGSTLLINGTNAAIQDKTGRNVLETVGNARVVNGVKKYGSGAMSFDGSGDYLVAPSSSELTLDADFTIEAWAYRGASGNYRLFTLGDTIGTAGIEIYVSGTPTGNWVVYSNGATRITGASATRGVWTHLAVVRSGLTVTLYVDGIASGSTWSSSSSFSGRLFVGAEFYNNGITSDTNGFIDDLRITKGVARTITVPTSTFPLK